MTLHKNNHITRTLLAMSLMVITGGALAAQVPPGTQLAEKAKYLYSCGAKEIHVRPACPPILFGCKYLNFSRSRSALELIARRAIDELEGRHMEDDELGDYLNPDSEKYQNMIEVIRKQQGYDTLQYNRLEDMLESVGIPVENLCTYCWDGKEE